MKKFLSLFCLTLNCVYAGPKSYDSHDDNKITSTLICSALIKSKEKKRSEKLEKCVKELPEEFLFNVIENIVNPNEFFIKIIGNEYNGEYEDIEFFEQKIRFERYFFNEYYSTRLNFEEYSPPFTKSSHEILMPIKILALFKQRIKRCDAFLSNFFHSKKIAQDFKKVLLLQVSDVFVQSRKSLPENPLFQSLKKDKLIYAKKDYDDYCLFLEFFKKNPKKTLLMIINKFEKKCSLFIDKNLREKNLNFEKNCELNALKDTVKKNNDYFLHKDCGRSEHVRDYTLIRENIKLLFDKKPLDLKTYDWLGYREDVPPKHLLEVEELMNKYKNESWNWFYTLEICPHQYINPKNFLKTMLNFNFTHKDYIRYTICESILEKVVFSMNSIFMELFLILENKKINKIKRIKVLQTINNLIVVNEVIKFYITNKHHTRKDLKKNKCNSFEHYYVYFNLKKN